MTRIRLTNPGHFFANGETLGWEKFHLAVVLSDSLFIEDFYPRICFVAWTKIATPVGNASRLKCIAG